MEVNFSILASDGWGSFRSATFNTHTVLPGRVDLIASSVVGFPFGSLETLQLVAGSLPSIPSSLTRVPIHLDLEHSDDSTDSDGGNSTSPREIYLTASVWSLESSLAPPACAFPSLSTIYPGDNTSKPN